MCAGFNPLVSYTPAGSARPRALLEWLTAADDAALYIHTARCAAGYWMDGLVGRPLRSAMARRNVFDPLEPTREPRWYTVRNMHNAVLEARVLPPGADLKRAFVAAMLEWIDAGWQLGEFSSTGGVFFCTRGTERRMVCITPSDPGTEQTYGASHLTESPGRAD
jgi:hypothetical protein